MNQQQIEQYLGPRGEHYHGGMGDAGCFSVCPVWDWDLRARKLQIDILDGSIKLLEDAQEYGERFIVNGIEQFKSRRIKLAPVEESE